MPANPPTTIFRDVDMTGVTTDLNSAAKRKDYNGTVVNNGGSNPWDFGTVDISMLTTGVTSSQVKTLMWRVGPSGNNGNTNADNFKFWVSRDGFEKNDTTINFKALSGGEVTTPSNTEHYHPNATTQSYSGWTTQAAGSTVEPASQNMYAADDAASLTLDGNTSDAVLLAAYFDVADEETTGTYEGTTAGYELQCSLKFDYN